MQSGKLLVRITSLDRFTNSTQVNFILNVEWLIGVRWFGKKPSKQSMSHVRFHSKTALKKCPGALRMSYMYLTAIPN